MATKKKSTGSVRSDIKLKVHWGIRFWHPRDLTDDSENLSKSAKDEIPANKVPRTRYTGHDLTFAKGVSLTIVHSSRNENLRHEQANLKLTASLDEWIDKLRADGVDPTQGTFELTLTPHPDETSSEPAGPTLGTTKKSEKKTKYDALWRPLVIRFGLTADFKMEKPEALIDPNVVDEEEVAHRGVHGYAYVATTKTESQILEVDWKPDWLRRIRAKHPLSKSGPLKGAEDETTHPFGKERGSTDAEITASIRAIVLHNVSGKREEGRVFPNLGSIHQFTAPWEKKNGVFLPGKKESDNKKENKAQDNEEKKETKTAFQGKASTKGIHYIVDVDGHVVKMIHEHFFVNHAHTARWLDISGSLNRKSIGIEHVLFAKEPDFEDAQIQASVDLVKKLEEHFNIDPRYVVGHGDVRSKGPESNMRLFVSDRKLCPGHYFPWHRFEEAGAAIAADKTFEAYETMYGSFFHLHPKGKLKEGQKDSKLNYGGIKKHRVSTFTQTQDGQKVPFKEVREVDGNPGTYVRRNSEQTPLTRDDTPTVVAQKRLPGPITSPVILELQEDLRRIGWAIDTNGNFDRKTSDAIKRFKGRFMLPGTDGKKEPTGDVDSETALRIKQVIATLRKNNDVRTFDKG